MPTQKLKYRREMSPLDSEIPFRLRNILFPLYVMAFIVVPARLRFHGGVSFPLRRLGRHRSCDWRRMRCFLRFKGEDRRAMQLLLSIFEEA